MIRGGAKSLALFGAGLILVAQLLALAHVHQGNPTRQFSTQTQLVADDGLCALCVLAFHAPLNPAATPSIPHPYADIRLVDSGVARLHVLVSFSPYRTRAPPAANV